jgi:hypothetical protein
LVDEVISSCGNACRTSCNTCSLQDLAPQHHFFTSAAISYCMVVWYRTYFYLDYLLIGGIILMGRGLGQKKAQDVFFL